jgi:tRNA uridine 5-carboxymethylaminomethyl modification enzyme
MNTLFANYDVIVIGGGHAGCEASYAAAKMGCKVLLITQHLNLLGMMSCNPSIGGIGKGQIVREIDALGGKTAIIADESMIQFRMLNKSKGPAMWSPRSQNDRRLFSFFWRKTLENEKNIDFWQDTVTDIIVENKRVIGVKTALQIQIFSKTVIITAGTFLAGRIYIGEHSDVGGRIGEHNAVGLTASLLKHGIESKKLKTGTSLRIDGRSIDFSKMTEQKGDEFIQRFSYTNTNIPKHQMSCYLTYTNQKVHDILKQGFAQSPLFTGRIQGTGPRYCPSIEDKIERFYEKTSHQLFIEPEGWDTFEYYINGFSSSLPLHIQIHALRYISGLENAKVLRPGYAIEYDYFPPTQLQYSLESSIIQNLFFAGQVNGTTGYEEAAAQGLISGINAAASILGMEALVLSRNNSYIGVLIDDLISKGVDEPYRMFTSRAEYRLLLRQTNADIRLSPIGYKYNLIDSERYNQVISKYDLISNIILKTKQTSVSPESINLFLESISSPPISQKCKLYQMILRNEVRLADIIANNFLELSVEEQAILSEDTCLQEEAEILIKYKSYIEREQEISAKLTRLEDIKLRPDFDYKSLQSISFEGREKLSKHKPQNIGQASRLPGVTPADVNALLIYLKR